MPDRIGRVPVVVVPLGLAAALSLAPWLGLGIYWNQEIVLTIALALLVRG
jgi:hypothetical protein